MENFYLFEVKEEYQCLYFDTYRFEKGERFIGWESKEFGSAFIANRKNLADIPLSKVRKVYKIKFKELTNEENR